MSTLSDNPIFSNRALVSLAVPIALEALLAIMAGLVDSAMVSSVGEAAVSAVSLIDSINILLIGLFAALANGGTVVTSQYIGNEDYANAKRSAKQLLYATTLAALVISTVVLPFVSPIIRLIYPDLEPIVFEYSKSYFFITLLGYVPAAMGNAASSLLRAQAKSRAAFILGTAINLFNVFGNAILIYGFDMGVAGAAISTTIARLIYGMVGMILLHNKALKVHFEKVLRFRPDFSILKKIFLIGGANGLETSLFYAGKLLLSSLVASFGTIATAAYAVSNTVCNIGWATITSLGTTLLTVVGQCVGANEKEQARYYTKKLTNVASIGVILIFGSMFLFRNQIVSLFGFGEDALAESAYYTGVGALATIFSIYSFSFVPMSAFRAAGDVRYPLIISLASMFVFRIGLAFILAKFFDMGLMAVWLGMWADWIFRAILNIFRVRGDKWLNKKVI